MGHSPLAIGFPEEGLPADPPLRMYPRSSAHRHLHGVDTNYHGIYTR